METLETLACKVIGMTYTSHQVLWWAVRILDDTEHRMKSGRVGKRMQRVRRNAYVAANHPLFVNMKGHRYLQST